MCVCGIVFLPVMANDFFLRQLANEQASFVAAGNSSSEPCYPTNLSHLYTRKNLSTDQ